MSIISRAIYIAPSVANPNGVGVGIGDCFVDPTGGEPGFAMVMGPNGAHTLFRVASQTIGPDTLTAASTSTGAGNRTLTFTLRDALGVVQPNRVVGLSLVGSGVIAVARTTGSGIVQATAQEAWLWGRTGAGGVFAVSITGTAADTVDYVASNVSANPGSAAAQVVIP